jgi:small subunit ribosomal protein S9
MTPVKKEEKPKKAAPKKSPAKKASAKAQTTSSKKHVIAHAAPVRMDAGSYIPSVGRRKTSIARVRLIKNGKGTILINERPYEAYFPVFEFQQIVRQPLVAAGQADAVDVSVHVAGGGLRGQSEATRLGIARALIVLNPTFRKSLKKEGYLRRDARAKERKKPGLKKARRAPQWSKR